MKRSCFVLAVVLVASPVARADTPEVEKAKEERALLGCRSLEQACEAYQFNPQNKTELPPTILLELVKPPFGNVPFVRNGEKDLLDPWGKMYRYAVAKDEKGRIRTYIWSEREVDGKTKVIGMKPPEPKKK